MSFTPQFLDELRSRLTLTDYVGKRVKLQKKGREHTGLCPFHSEKTPSFTVNNDKAFFHCFGCGAHGSAIDWAMQMEGLSFPEAVERLASDAGMAVPQSTPEEQARAKRAKTLLDANEAACGWFEKQLYQADGRSALDYLRGRGLTEETIARFRLGFAPDKRDGLGQALQADGYEEAMLIEAGLIAKPDDGRAAYDRFRGRVIFPITDRRGRVIAFGGRIMADREGVAKYLNSPETPLFHKGRTLYALALAREASANGAEVIVTEGYMDVIALHQAGFGGAVAPLGTAVTEDHIQALWRLAPEPVMCFDGDNAGQRAAQRAAERTLPLLKPGHSLRFSVLPGGEDPDSLLQAGGKAAMETVLAAAKPLVDVIWMMESAGKPQDTPERRALIRKNLRDRADDVGDPSVRQSYWEEFDGRLADLFGRGSAPGRQRQHRGASGRRGQKGGAPVRDASLQSDGNTSVLEMRARQALLATAINHPAILEEVGEALGTLEMGGSSRSSGEDFEGAEGPSGAPGGDLDRIRQEILTISAIDLDSEAIQDHLRSLGLSDLLQKILSRDVYELAPFAAPSATREQALSGWLDLCDGLMRQRALERDIQNARQALAQDVTARNWEHLNALWRVRQESVKNPDESIV